MLTRSHAMLLTRCLASESLFCRNKLPLHLLLLKQSELAG
jgi:hypothetical protein